MGLRRGNEPVDLALVVSPLSTHAYADVSVDGCACRLASYHLRHEVAELRANGLPTFVLEPGPEAVAAMGHDLLSSESCVAAVGAACLGVGRCTARQLGALRDTVGHRRVA